MDRVSEAWAVPEQAREPGQLTLHSKPTRGHITSIVSKPKQPSWKGRAQPTSLPCGCTAQAVPKGTVPDWGHQCNRCWSGTSLTPTRPPSWPSWPQRGAWTCCRPWRWVQMKLGADWQLWVPAGDVLLWDLGFQLHPCHHAQGSWITGGVSCPRWMKAGLVQCQSPARGTSTAAPGGHPGGDAHPGALPQAGWLPPQLWA